MGSAINKITQERLISLDVFRGFTICLMIVVNSPGLHDQIYSPLAHSDWNGVTTTDLVFPFFLFIVGVSAVLGLGKQVTSGLSEKTMVIKIIKRAAIIFALGILLNLFFSGFTSLRIPGVLQRIAIVFLICGLLFLKTDWKGQLKVGLMLLIGYWMAMVWIPVPGIGVGVLEPGKNLASWIDSQLIPFKMYKGTWDPEGLLSTLPALATAISGMLVGHIIKSNQDQKTQIIWIFLAGFLAFCFGSIWGWFFPMNKSIWTSSYVLYTSGIAAMTLASSIWFVDVMKFSKGLKLGIIFGANSIVAYMLHGVLKYPLYMLKFAVGETSYSVKSFIMESALSTGMDPKLASALWAFGFTSLCFVPIWVMYRKGIFIKV
ncbi:MAG: DUF5009 domain-containing protein [Emcibacter sp.]|nr:DUF5009 domain-containing protein [Emcibacter sp.]